MTRAHTPPLASATAPRCCHGPARARHAAVRLCRCRTTTRTVVGVSSPCARPCCSPHPISQAHPSLPPLLSSHAAPSPCPEPSAPLRPAQKPAAAALAAANTSPWSPCSRPSSTRAHALARSHTFPGSSTNHPLLPAPLLCTERGHRRSTRHGRRPSAEAYAPAAPSPKERLHPLPHVPVNLPGRTSPPLPRRSTAAATAARRLPLLTVAGAPRPAPAHTETTYVFILNP